MNKRVAHRSLLAAAATTAVVATAAFPAVALAAPGQTRTATNCAEYAPVHISTDVSTVAAGAAVTITGILLAGDVVTITLSIGGETITLGTVTADSTGRFTLEATIPENAPNGVATISATSPNCPAPLSTTVSITGGSDTTVPNPAECTTGGISVEFPNVKLIEWDGYNPKVEYTPIVPVSLAPGEWSIIEAVSWDSYAGRVTANQQTSEIWEIEFLAGDEVVARSQPTEDLEDFVETAEWRGSLGTVTLTKPVDGVRAHHRPDLFPPVDPWGIANSVFAVSANFCLPPADTTPEPEDTTPEEPGDSTPEDGEVESETTSAPTTAAPGGVVDGSTSTPSSVLGASVTNVGGPDSAEVKGAVENRNLAWTGTSAGLLVRVASILIAAGGLLALRYRRDRLAKS